jgi:hypothetical protein
VQDCEVGEDVLGCEDRVVRPVAGREGGLGRRRRQGRADVEASDGEGSCEAQAQRDRGQRAVGDEHLVDADGRQAVEAVRRQPSAGHPRPGVGPGSEHRLDGRVPSPALRRQVVTEAVSLEGVQVDVHPRLRHDLAIGQPRPQVDQHRLGPCCDGDVASGRRGREGLQRLGLGVRVRGVPDEAASTCASAPRWSRASAPNLVLPSGWRARGACTGCTTATRSGVVPSSGCGRGTW